MDNRELKLLLDWAKKNREPKWLVDARRSAYIAQKEIKDEFSRFKYNGPPLSEWVIPIDAPEWNWDQKEPYHFTFLEAAKHSSFIKSYMDEPYKNEWKAISRWAFRKGLFIKIPDSKRIKDQIFIRENKDGERFSEPLLIEVGKRSEVNILIEVPKSKISNLSIRLKADSDSIVNLGIIAQNQRKCFANMDLAITLERNCHLNLDGAWFQEEWTNVNIKTETPGEGASIEEKHLFYYNGKSHLTVTSNTLLNAPHGQSIINVKGAIDGSSRAVFNGMVTISKHAPESSAHLNDSVLLLSDKARADAIPALEILNSNVKATHCASIGTVDDEEVFYLESRGLSFDESKTMIVEGFLSAQAGEMFRGNYDIRPVIHERLIKK